MPNRTTLIIIATAALGLAPWTPPAQAAATNFNFDIAHSATRVIVSGEQRMEQRYFHKNALTNRMEMQVQGQLSTIIINADRGVMWILMPAQQMYLESPIDDQAYDAANVELPDPATWEMEREGRESVNGVPATRYRVATDDGETTRMQGHLWVSDDGIAVRTDMMTGGDRIQMELRDLVVGPQAADLFEPPPGYQRMALGEGMGGAMSLPGLGSIGPGASGVPEDGEGPGFADELAAEAAEEAKRTAEDEVRHSVRDSVRKGLRSLLPGK